MTYQNFTLDIDADGIALVTWNMPGRSMNVIDAKVTEELAASLLLRHERAPLEVVFLSAVAAMISTTSLRRLQPLATKDCFSSALCWNP